MLATNREHARRHGHAMVLRWVPSAPQIKPWQWRHCGNITEVECTREYERANYNWEKHLYLVEYLKSAESFAHVMMIDADVVLVQPEHDTLGRMAVELVSAGKELMLSDEDW